jgi:hypothetical protein
MTQDSGGSERPQRTVAELLAEFGGNTDGAPRRRRRRAEDDGDSAPQTIIERVLSDSGKLLPIREDEPQQAPRRPGGHRSERRPAQPAQPAPQPQQPPAQPAAQPPTAYAEPVRKPQQRTPSRQLPPARAPQKQPPQQPPQQQQPLQQQPQQSPQHFPPSRPGMPPATPPPGAQQPPPGPPTTVNRPVPPPQQASRPGVPSIQRTPPPNLRPPVGPRPPVDDESETAVHPALPDDFEYLPAAQPPTVLTPPVQARLSPGGLPPEATTEEFPLVGDEPPANNQDGRPTQIVSPVAPPGRRPPGPPTRPGMESTQEHAGPYEDDDYEDDFAPHGAPAKDDEAFGGRDEYDELDDGPVNRLESFDDDEEDAPAGGREWFIMAAQVGAGAIAGAAVWLGFSWLWGFQPVAAVVAALLVIVGLVLGVRRWRRADDLQTTVLAILAGLVVTVSPAALLLLHR